MKLLLGICRLFGILAVTSVWLAATKAAAKGEGTESGAGSLLSGQVRFFSNGQELGEASSLSVAVGDLDGDGDLDAVVGNIGLNRVWRNDGHGRFQRTRGNLGGEWTYGIGLHDLDRDGDLDVYAANYGSADTVWLNTGDGRFIKSAQNLVAARSMAVALGDLDGDGDADALVGTNGEGGRILLNTGNGIFEERTGSLGDAPTYGVALGDLDGDGDLDAICANNGVESESWINDGEGRFTHGEGTSGNTFAARNSWGVALGDLDRDGDLDAVFANDGLNTIWYNDGRAGFREINVSQEGGSTFDIALRDVDGNETIDIFAANYYHPSGTVSLSTGDGRFSDASENFPSESHFGIALGDFDGDGDQDAWVANRNGPNRVWLNGGLSPESAESVQRPPNFIVVLADDLGYGDVGPFGAKDVHTPNLDRLAREGIRLTSFYAHPVCAPSRAALMTGSYPIRVAEPGNRKGYRIILHPEEITIAEILNSGGYATACIGKWHLAGEGEEPWEYYNGEFDPDARIPDHPGRTGPFRPEYLPNEQGFGYYFGTPLFNRSGFNSPKLASYLQF